MVQSSYKNRKKNRKQSFKRKNTDGNRKVKFIEDDKMVGGDGEQEHIAKLVTKYSGYPLGSLIRTAFSNAKCATEEEGVCSIEGISSLKNAYNNCKQIIGIGKENDNKLNALFFESFKYTDADKNAINIYKRDDNFYYRFIEDVMKFICINVFIPKDLIQKVHVQNDDGTNWTTLKNNNFKEVKSGTDNEFKERRAKGKGNTKRAATQERDDGNGENSTPYRDGNEAFTEDAEATHLDAAGSGNSEQQESALAPKGAVTTGLGQEQYDIARLKGFEDAQQNVSASKEDAIKKWGKFNNDGTATEDMLDQQSAAGASVNVAPSSATTGPQQLNEVQELMNKINAIAKKEEGYDADVVEMRTLLRDLRTLLATISDNMLDNNDDKATLKTLNTKLRRLSDITDFARFSEEWFDLAKDFGTFTWL